MQQKQMEKNLIQQKREGENKSMRKAIHLRNMLS